MRMVGENDMYKVPRCTSTKKNRQCAVINLKKKKDGETKFDF